MQVEKVKEDGLSREIKVTVAASDIKKQRDTRLQEVGKTVRLPGFRPGKVPLDVLDKRYGKAVMGEVLEKVVNETSMQALKDEGITPAMQPNIEVESFDEGKDLTYKMEVEVIPEFDVMDTKGIKLERPVAEPDKKEIEDTLKRVAAQNRDSKKIEGDRPAKKGDILLMDFHGKTKDDGVEHPGMHAHGHKLELGSGQFIGGFEDQLVGKKAGEQVTVDVTFPEDYQATELAGRDAEFKVDIHEIHESVEAEINDELAQKLGMADAKSLEEAVKAQLQMECDQLSRMKIKRALLDILDKEHEFSIPQKMWDMEYENIVKQVEQDQQDSAEKLSDEEQEELRAIANRRVRLGLILANIGNANNVSVSDQELQQAVIREAQRYPGQEKQLFDFYQNNPQALESLRAPVFEDKVVDMLLDQAEVTEKKVDIEFLRSEDEDEAPKAKKSTKKPAKKKAAKKDSGGESKKKTPAKKKSSSKAKKKA